LPDQPYFTIQSLISAPLTDLLLTVGLTLTVDTGFSDQQTGAVKITSSVRIINDQSFITPNSSTPNKEISFDSQKGKINSIELDDQSWFVGSFESLSATDP